MLPNMIQEVVNHLQITIKILINHQSEETEVELQDLLVLKPIIREACKINWLRKVSRSLKNIGLSAERGLKIWMLKVDYNSKDRSMPVNNNRKRGKRINSPIQMRHTLKYSNIERKCMQIKSHDHLQPKEMALLNFTIIQLMAKEL